MTGVKCPSAVVIVPVPQHQICQPVRAEHVSGPVGRKSCWKLLGPLASCAFFGKETPLARAAREGEPLPAWEAGPVRREQDMPC